MTRRITGLFAALTMTLVLASCHGGHMMMDHSHDMMAMKAVAVIRPTAGNNAAGVITFTSQGDDKIRLTGEITGLTPNQEHGFHIHEFGDTSATDGTSAGSHFDPMGTAHHGTPADDMKMRHAGDMGNIKADGTGKVTVDMVISGVTMHGHNGILGRAIVVHGRPDDFGQPVGNAGPRIGVGVIGVAKMP